MNNKCIGNVKKYSTPLPGSGVAGGRVEGPGAASPWTAPEVGGDVVGRGEVGGGAGAGRNKWLKDMYNECHSMKNNTRFTFFPIHFAHLCIKFFFIYLGSFMQELPFKLNALWPFFVVFDPK